MYHWMYHWMYLLPAINSDLQTRLLNVFGQIATFCFIIIIIIIIFINCKWVDTRWQWFWEVKKKIQKGIHI
jgi:hypothetical protein